MEAGKGVKVLVMCVLVLSLVLQEPIQVEAEAKSCCPSTTARNIYNTCLSAGGSKDTCAKLSGCKFFNGSCIPPYIHHTLHPDSEDSEVLDFCKLGCTLSVCSNMENTFAGIEEGNGVVGRCNDACIRFCTKEADALNVVA